ncbi:MULTISPECIES: DUF4225 domain-containing protein [Yersinia pseudotuberculosis complex]|uniref:DUF4225 domain-containing protein n=1 Tax=Yersinia pseudotuberculosis serotype O:1b (strain IP 31758) TaxID=349747 RepID=A0A0U1QTN3_YERP3|nr:MULTISPECIES: DUF4225 domain-containing protein [Yersinia pseudotuberculosis complex]ABS45742.1 conserved hypothetical protein [Yersinia pseudotuberculosis IP 31758]MCE4113225.1 DUF4225 domain-containing protein [Yersinia pseudotuberculosis]RYC26239.1 DUF4225 domain-containing protein [Yersinia pseudotuberculosis]UFA64064.1 DUF4225 domain-containing protein [Yersinia pseudotuberculosis]WLF06006.1 DUF4225 domain-containing protein [Yersinia pseudotuberculosis]
MNNYIGTYNKNSYFETMINLEARKLIDITNQLSFNYLKSSSSKISFVSEIKSLIDEQFNLFRKSKSDSDCMRCIQNLKSEYDALHYQDRLIRNKNASFYSSIKIIKENERIIGYVITGFNIILGGVQLFTGGLMMSTMPVLGQMFGVIMVVDGVNTVDKNVSKLLGDNETEGLVADGFISTAGFLGVERNSALASYTAISLGANVYSIYGLAFRSNSWKLFYTMRSDFVRKVDNMSMPKLSIKMVGYGLKAKVIIDLMSTDSIN